MAWCICGLNDALNGRRHNCRHPDGPRWSEIDPHKAAPEPVAVLTAIHAFDDLYPTKPASHPAHESHRCTLTVGRVVCQRAFAAARTAHRGNTRATPIGSSARACAQTSRLRRMTDTAD